MFRLSDMFFGHFVDKLDRGDLSTKDVSVFECLYDALIDTNPDNLTQIEMDYHQKLIRGYEQISKKKAVDEIENSLDIFSRKIQGPCIGGILTREEMEDIFGSVLFIDFSIKFQYSNLITIFYKAFF